MNSSEVSWIEVSMFSDDSSKVHGDKVQTPKQLPTENGSKPAHHELESPLPHAHPSGESDKIHGDKLDTNTAAK